MQVGGVRTREVNALESHFLQLIEWKLHVTPEDLHFSYLFFFPNAKSRSSTNIEATYVPLPVAERDLCWFMRVYVLG